MKLDRRLSSEVPAREPTVIPIRAGASHYEVLIGSGLLGQLGEHASRLFRGKRCAIIADEQTARHFWDELRQSLEANHFTATLLSIPAGEASKSLEQVGRLCDEMATAGLDRTSFLIALGGGVVGDVAGFAAAIYHRGIPYLHVPTTLLAQVDSAIGGKTAVNTSAGKNLLGAVHQPALVVADVETLRTLPAREFRQGLAEIIKHGIIADPDLLDLSPTLLNTCPKVLQEVVARNVAIKAGVVAQDAQDETGRRAVLNFGHTAGHAIERVAGYGTLRHGEAISLGIVAACEISVRRAGLSEAERRRVIDALTACELPTQLPAAISREEILRAVLNDKKFDQGRVRFVVSPRLGSAHLTSDVSLEDIRAALAAL